ncbi:HEPN domain-containing protein [Anatilimnocola floriformis]|uniref:HEPN domain-containing protein n=1 Tax=Anatilimnocola floriformis TaxID=2948575 RepID=UPI0020C39BDA|nr:HEPN domain-containing protein [Anatilimnocola floriformis]
MATYEGRKLHPNYWFNKSSDLHGAAAVLWTAMNNDDTTLRAECALDPSYRFKVALPLPFRMLCGMSIELLLKAIIVAHSQEPGMTHGLSSLARAAGVKFADSQLPLLEILSQTIVWDGRYPVPTPKNQQSFEKLSTLKSKYLRDRKTIGKMQFLVANAALDWTSYNQIRSVALQKFYSTAPVAEAS